uniref:Uncharacterized protein n=1 Tax=Oryza sativa subsp. japonica TaxID=39947 RepID=Q6K7V3_ORYSJ|nr:hypothetical protein [Oryza sativa Japonica Group]BAD28676.1 hypothetical protein [Oryza sativa Japonica Group]
MFFFSFSFTAACMISSSTNHSYYPQIIRTPQIIHKIHKYIKLHFLSPNTSQIIHKITKSSPQIHSHITHHTDQKKKSHRTDRPHRSEKEIHIAQIGYTHRTDQEKTTSQRSGAGRPPPRRPAARPPWAPPPPGERRRPPPRRPVPACCRLGLRRPPRERRRLAGRLLGRPPQPAACPAACLPSRRLPGRPPLRALPTTVRRPASRGRRRRRSRMRREGRGMGEKGWKRIRMEKGWIRMEKGLMRGEGKERGRDRGGRAGQWR